MTEYEIGQIFEENPKTGELYPSETAEWCNNGSVAHIEEIDPITKEVEEEYMTSDENGNTVTKTRMVEKTLRRFQIVANPEPTVEEKQTAVRAVRDEYLATYIDPVVSNPLRWGDLSEAEKQQYTDYRRYLLDYPESGDAWYEQNPLTFDEWKDKE